MFLSQLESQSLAKAASSPTGALPVDSPFTSVASGLLDSEATPAAARTACLRKERRFRMVLNLTLYEVAYRALRRSTAVDSAAWSRIDCRIQRTNLTLRWVARRACRTRVDRSWPAAAHFWAAASVRLIRR